MKSRIPSDYMYWVEMSHPKQDIIFSHEMACKENGIPFQVLWVESSPCLVCTWEHFREQFSLESQEQMNYLANKFMKKQKQVLREMYVNNRPLPTLIFSECRWQCIFDNLPHMDAGRRLAAKTGRFLMNIGAFLREKDLITENEICNLSPLPPK